MRIAIDARFYGTEHTGLGRYTQNVLNHLPHFLPEHHLYVFLSPTHFRTLKLPKNCTKISAKAEHYTFAEQVYIPYLLSRGSYDLYFSFHFNVPLLIPIPFVATIHDVIKSHFVGLDTTTRSQWLFFLKRIGYNLSINHVVNNAKHLIVPTNTVKNDILADFDADPTAISVISEAPDPIFRSSRSTSKLEYLPANYLLFVGNAYPHKNLEILLKYLASKPKEELIIVSNYSVFLQKLLEQQGEEVKNRLTILSKITDQELVSLYKNAKALVAPSLMEGYGLPGLEAMMVGTPVVASDIPVFREVYSTNATFFEPHSVSSLTQAIRSAKPSRIKFPRTWEVVAQEIAEVINASCSSIRSA